MKKTPHDSVCVLRELISFGCRMQARLTQRWLKSDTKCSVQGCILGKLQIIDSDPEDSSPHYVRYDLCGEHKCAVPRCPDEKSSADGKNGFLPYCRKRRLDQA